MCTLACGLTGEGKSLRDLTPHLRSPVFACLFQQPYRGASTVAFRAATKYQFRLEAPIIVALVAQAMLLLALARGNLRDVLRSSYVMSKCHATTQFDVRARSVCWFVFPVVFVSYLGMWTGFVVGTMWKTCV